MTDSALSTQHVSVRFEVVRNLPFADVLAIFLPLLAQGGDVSLVDVIAERVPDEGITFEFKDRLTERDGKRAQIARAQFLVRDAIETLLDGFRQRQVLLDAIEPRGEHDREREVGVRGRIGAAQLQLSSALGAGIAGHTNERLVIHTRPDEEYGRFVT